MERNVCFDFENHRQILLIVGFYGNILIKIDRKLTKMTIDIWYRPKLMLNDISGQFGYAILNLY